MTRDLLDALLDDSRPATRMPAPPHLSAMIAAARAEARPPRRRRVAVASGALAILLAGGAGVAAATDGFTWAPWAQNPVGSVGFTMSNGFECELRFSEYTSGPDAAFLAHVNGTLADWYRSTDVVAAAQALVPHKREEFAALQSDQQKAELESQLAELSPSERAEAMAHNAWSEEWIAWDLAVSDLETRALKEAGISVPDERFVGSTRISGIQCLDLDGRPYLPGAGS